jgi:Ala-tRNA(Pro) deacylase
LTPFNTEIAMVAKKLREFLDSHNIRYATISHPISYTAQGTAALAHVPSKDLAKTVIVKIDGALAMAVLPASYEVDLALLRASIGAETLCLAKEREFKESFPECELGAMPPFGNLYGMAVFVDESLTQEKEIVFNAGSHNELIRISYEDFERLVKPTVLKLACPPDMELLGAWHL